MKLKQSGKKSRKIIIALVAVVLITGGAAATFAYLKSNQETPTETINYTEATDEEKQEAEDHKKDISDNNDSANQPSNDGQDSGDNKKTVTPLITVWGQQSAGSDFKLNGYVPGIIETDGKCTLTLTKGNKKATKTRVALADAKNTTCGQTIISYNDLEPGEWKAVLSYNSPHSSGSSEVTLVEVK